MTESIFFFVIVGVVIAAIVNGVMNAKNGITVDDIESEEQLSKSKKQRKKMDVESEEYFSTPKKQKRKKSDSDVYDVSDDNDDD